MNFSSTNNALESLTRRAHVNDTVRGLASGALNDMKESGGKRVPTYVIFRLLGSEDWEAIATGIYLAVELVKRRCEEELDEDTRLRFIHAALDHLEHSEVRVRNLVAALVRELAQSSGVDKTVPLELYHNYFKERLIQSITDNFERTATPILNELGGGTKVALDDTSGWKALETSINMLQNFVQGIGRPFIDKGYWSPVLMKFTCLGASKHLNRHVRESSFGLIDTVIHEMSGQQDQKGDDGVKGSFLEVMKKFSEAIASGLADNWSQVRFAASVANRTFLGSLRQSDREERYFLLLPCMCLNRHYLAEGVKLYSQETWRIFLGSDGVEAVTRHIVSVVDYYVKVAEADNHVVREAACHSITELCLRISKDALSPHVPKLLSTLLICFKDESWPVRDAACLTTGHLASSYQNECATHKEQLYTLWFKHLSEPIWTVREDSAETLALVCRTYGDDALQRCRAWIRVNLPKAQTQPPQRPEEALADQNNISLHTDRQRYSCGSLAPKLRKGGCSDCVISRPASPWEYTDGALYLLRRLCEVSSTFLSSWGFSSSYFLKGIK